MNKSVLNKCVSFIQKPKNKCKWFALALVQIKSKNNYWISGPCLFWLAFCSKGNYLYKIKSFVSLPPSPHTHKIPLPVSTIASRRNGQLVKKVTLTQSDQKALANVFGTLTMVVTISPSMLTPCYGKEFISSRRNGQLPKRQVAIKHQTLSHFILGLFFDKLTLRGCPFLLVYCLVAGFVQIQHALQAMTQQKRMDPSKSKSVIWQKKEWDEFQQLKFHRFCCVSTTISRRINVLDEFTFCSNFH